MDALSIAVDEVALEGLDGITIPTLWIRLENRKPTFPLKLDPSTKEFIWRSLVSNTELNFYELPQEREDLELVDRFKDIDPDTGIEYTQESFEAKKDIYSIHIIPENKDGIQGSCSFFKERTDVTKHVRSKSLTAVVSLEEAFQRYGRKLVVVGSQTLRFRALVGAESDPDLKLTDGSYCILERVGRARWQGELQRDLHVCSFKTDARKFHYMRMSLVKHGLVTMQPHLSRLQSGQQQHSILLLLKRFHVNRRSKYDILMEHTSNFLEQMPGQCVSLSTIKEHLNLNERTSKNVFQYMRAAKLIEFVQIPLEEIDPNAGPCTTKRGTKVQIRCVKLLKPFSKRGITDNDEEKEDEDEEDDSRVRRRAVPSEGRIMERDFLSQAYHIVMSSGTRGISQSALGYRMNIGKLEARMLCRKLERDDLVKTFMEDEGRQRTTKYISHKCVGVSDRMQQFAKEQERSKLLHSCAPQTPNTSPSTCKTPSNSGAKAKGDTKTLSAKKILIAAVQSDEDSKEARQSCGGKDQDAGDEGLDGDGAEARKMTAEKQGMVTTTKQTKPEMPITHPTSTKCENPDSSKSSTSMKAALESGATAEEAPVEEGEESVENPASPSDQIDAVNPASNPAENSNTVVEDIVQHEVSDVQEARKSLSRRSERSHETYRLLRRKNLIVEAVHTLKIIEGLLPLQKMINDEEKQDGSSSKCCKKTILRLIHSLSREGLLKLYTTTVIQDGISKKVDMVVHPSVQPSDDIVKRAIEQVRFRISSSYTVVRQQQAEEKAREQAKELEETAAKSQRSKADKKKTSSKDEEKFKPIIVKGLSRTWGFQPKMHRLRLVHNFLWHVIYGHSSSHKTTGAHSSNQTPIDTNSSNSDAKHTGTHENPLLPNQTQSGTNEDTNNSTNTNGQTQVCVNPATAAAADLQTADSALSKLDVTLSGDEEEDTLNLDYSESDIKVYIDEDSWKRFIPPVRVNKEFGLGWCVIRDLLLCLPLSLFIQITQINYKVDGLEEYLNDPVKQHYLVRALPSKMRRQLLYKRKYIFSFYENLQRLAYMGLLQFGPVEKFKEKDQVFVYLRQKVTIVDTTNAEPHYWLITESPDKPFERRQYTLTTAEDVENYWFDLMCVCLNTPLGVIRSKRGAGGEEEEATPSFVRERNVFIGMAYLLKGSREVCDDGSIPGDGKGAGGLDSEFFAHLKRNWLWTNHLLSVKANQKSGEVNDSRIRLKSLLTKNALRIALKAGESTSPRYVTAKRSLITEQEVEVAIEPASRNQQIAGGKRQKRKRNKKEVVKLPRKKKKEPRKRTPAHDEADHRALKMMTKQRVYWSVQEDSLMMLCSVASHLLNSKLKRPFVAYCVVRDLLQAEIEMSMDKTSLAVARRTRYILKNPQTLLNYRICLAEVYQDKALMKLLEKKKPANPDSPDDCAKAFSEYTRLLRQKFSSFVNSCGVVMPDTKHQLFSRFKVCTIDSGKRMSCEDAINCTDDIHAIVLNNLIQSTLAMSNYQMKSCRSFQTFHIYGKYDQELLCRVFLRCRKEGLVNRRRVNPTTGPKKNRALPILPMSYQLSQSYYRCFSWRFPHTLCTDVFRFLRSLTDKGAGDDRPMTSFYHETVKRAENGEEVLQRGAVTERKDKESQGKKDSRPLGESVEQSGKVNNESTREGQNDQSKAEGQEMELEPNNDKAEITSKTHEQHPLKKAEDSLTDECGLDPSSREHTKGHQPQIHQPVLHPASNHPPQASKQPPDMSGLLRYSLESPGGACAACLSLMTLGLLSVHVSIPKQMVVVDSSLVESDFVKSLAALDEEDDDDDDGEDNEGTKRLEVKAHQASHTKYLMMRGYCCPGIVKLRNLNTTDNIVVESCAMRLQLRNAPAHKIFNVEDSLQLNLNKCGPSLVPSILTYSIRPPSSSDSCVEDYDRHLTEQKGYTLQDVEVCAELRRSLDQAGENGMSIYDLYQAHVELAEPRCGRTRSLQQYVEELQDDGQVLKVGALGVRWVLTQHAEPWLLTINCKPWAQSQGSCPLWENRHKIPFIRKRNREVQRETEEPPAKKVAGDKEGDEDKEGARGLSSKITEEKLNKEQQLEEQKAEEDKKHGEKLLNSGKEEAKQMLPEEEGEEEAVLEKVETERRSVRLEENERQQRDTEDRTEAERDEEASLSPVGPAAPDENGNLSFISRPWRLVDGKLNRQACKGMMEAVLYHIMSRPGLTQQGLVEHYKGILQPVAVMDLLQALIELDCVRKRTLIKAPKPSLFSRSVGQTRGQTEVRVEELDTVFYEPTISCCLRLAQVLPNERQWNSFI